MQDAQPPREVQDAFNDAVKAREDEVRLINEARAYAAERPSMGKTIDRHEMIADYLDEMATDIQALRALAMHGGFHEEMAQKLALLLRFMPPADETERKRTEQAMISGSRLEAAATLAGGEAQRIKLARELAKRATGRTLYILDEPTTGLHFQDIKMLLKVLNRLRDQGNTVIVIEHNLDVIRSADWVIDLGPEGGNGGGEIIAAGTPQAVADVEDSYTGQFLRSVPARPRRKAS
mgnify:CR=1 FL=1